MAIARRKAVTVLGHQRGEDAFAQAPIGDAQALARPYPEQGFENGAAGEHEIGALLTDARLSHALGIAPVSYTHLTLPTILLV